ncbi:MAG TPA: hypothetical protein P5568_07650 [Acidobacteriota bacterium]|nr:hypothetical protein [Acidobacteriota bacterium]HRV08329.1 hypothetical protein [Acidobacteriota bacterium]
MPFGVCPKCGFQIPPDGVECPRCGIVLAKYRHRSQVPPDPPPLPAGRDALPPGRLALRVARWFVMIAAVMVLYLLFNPAPAPVVLAGRSDLESALSKIQRFENGLEHRRRTEITLSEGELNAWLRQGLAQWNRKIGQEEEETPQPEQGREAASSDQSETDSQGIQVTDLRIKLLFDRLRAHLRFRLYGKELSLELEGIPTVDGGYLELLDLSGKIGSLPVPGPTLHLLWDRLVKTPDARERLRLPEGVEFLSVEPGQLTLACFTE